MKKWNTKLLLWGISTMMAAGCSAAGTASSASATAAASATASAAVSASASAGSEQTDGQKFAAEYTAVSADNLFVYRSAEQIITILEHGTGVVYLGFPSCPWCQAYVKLLNETAQQAGIKKIYYYDIKQDRSDNSESYQKMVELLGDNLLFDDEGKPRIYVPDVTVVKDGKIIGHDNTSSVVTDADGTPEQYWTAERIQQLEEKLLPWLQEAAAAGCTECNMEEPTATASSQS